MKSNFIAARIGLLVRRFADLAPPTARGLFIGFLAGFALWRFGFGSLDLVLFVVGVAGLVLLVLTGLTVALSAFYLRRRLEKRVGESEMSIQQLEAGSLIRTGFKTPALERVPMVKVAWEWLEPEGVECRLRLRDGWRIEEVLAHRRCLVSHIRRRFSVYDVFGLAKVSWERDYPLSLMVLPAVGRLRQMPVVQSFASREGIPHPQGAVEGDRMEIRRYQPGDSIRHILWKTYARTQQLNVRLPERSVDRSQRTVAYLIRGEGDEAAAAAARVAIESGALGERWVFGADGSNEPVSELGSALELIARSGGPQKGRDPLGRSALNNHGHLAGQSNGDGESSALGLSGFLDRVANQGEANCIVFVPGRAGTWTSEVLRLATGYRGQLSFVLGIDGVQTNGHESLWRRLLFADETEDGLTSEELSELLRQVASIGGSALVVDRKSGKTFGGGRQNTTLRLIGGG